ncbi:hypothetical protein ACT4S5_01705 [Kocuria oceani]|uniref:hypothetical protein n=1 Tax=Kocuria oceani TaxID=988827 RepID=UPI00403744C2
MTPHFTPEQAREQLAEVQARRLDTSGDRAVHAWATAAFGGITAFYAAAQNMLSDWVSHTALTLAFVTAWLATGWWVERAARTVPRRAKAWSRLGLAGSLLLVLTVVLPWLNYSAQTAPNTWPMVAAGAAAAAAPALLAAAVIRWRAQ